MLNNKLKKRTILYILILFLLIIFIGLPFLVVMKNVFGDKYISFDEVREFIFSSYYGESMINSFKYSFIASLLSVGIGFFLAYGIYKTNLKFKKIISVVILLPMIIPTFSIGLGVLNIFSSGGFLSMVFGIDIGIYGFNGLVIGSVFYSYPVSFLVLSQTFKYENSSLYEVSEVLNVSKLKKFIFLTLPRFKKTFILTFFAVFVMIYSDFGVPSMLSGMTKTLPNELYAQIHNFNFPFASAVGLGLLVPIIIYSIALLILKKDNNTENSTNIYISKNNVRDVIYNITCAIIVLFIILFVSLFFIVALANNYPNDLGFNFNIIKSLKLFKVEKFIMNSLVTALLASIIGVLLAYISAYFKERKDDHRLLMFGIDIFATLSVLIPGLVVGLGYLLIFQGTPIYNTIIIVVIVNVAHFFTSPYMMARGAIETIDDNYEAVCKVLNISETKMFLNVIIPNTNKTIVEMFTYMFTNSMITISAVSILTSSNSNIKPLAVMINYFNEKGYYAESSAIAALIFIINIIVISLGIFVKKYINNKVRDINAI